MNRLVISLIILMCVACVYGAIRPSQRVTEPDKVEQHNLVQEEIFKHLDAIYDSLVKTNYTWSDTGRTNSLGGDTVVLPFSYSNENYTVAIAPSIGSMVQVVVISPDSFVVVLTYPDFTGSAIVAREDALYRYTTIGLIP